jgi:hypothetical protein
MLARVGAAAISVSTGWKYAALVAQVFLTGRRTPAEYFSHFRIIKRRLSRDGHKLELL